MPEVTERTAPIYLDHNATSPLRREAFEAMRPLLEAAPAANASSPHLPGQRARYAVEIAREEVAALLGCEAAEVVFTSGGTESDNIAILGALEAIDSARPGKPHLVSTSIEHPAVEECVRHLESRGVAVRRVAPGGDGIVSLSAIEAAWNSETSLVSIMLANNETGAIQPVGEIAGRARARGILVHSDAVQAAGRLPVDFRQLGVDLLSVSAHKMGGPQGVGALVVRRGVEVSPRILGGPQERRRRGGTEPAALIAGFGEAARLARIEMGRWDDTTRPLRDALEEGIRARFPFARLHGAAEGAPAPADRSRCIPRRLPNTVSVAFPGRSAEAVVMALDLEGIAVSTGSACSSGATRPSRVLSAMGLDEHEVRSTIRISFGPSNRPGDVDRLLAALEGVLAGARGETGAAAFARA